MSAPVVPPEPAAPVDWDRALRLARAATPPGPRATGPERAALVALLHEAAAESPARVGALTGLQREARAVGRALDVRVVDRDAARRAAVDALPRLAPSPGAPTPEDARTSPAGPASAEAADGAEDVMGAWVAGTRPSARRAASTVLGAGRALGRRAGAVVGPGLATTEVAAALGTVSTRLLGEVLPSTADPAAATDALDDAVRAPRILLVAPNVLALARREDLDLADLARWVALHETVHAVQLAAAPWLAAHLAEAVGDVVRALAARDPAAARGRAAALSAVLALLEGHAEAALDGVGPTELGSVHRLRAVVGPARSGALADALARLTGVRAKGAQHADGAAFVRAVLADAGPAGLAAAWAAPGNLPRPDEIADPGAWRARVLDEGRPRLPRPPAP